MKRLMPAVMLLGAAVIAHPQAAQTGTVGGNAGWLANYCTDKLSVITDSQGNQSTTWNSPEGAYCFAFLKAASQAFKLLYEPDYAVMQTREILAVDSPAEVYAILCSYLRRHTELSRSDSVFVVIKALKESIRISCDEPCKPLLEEDLPVWYRLKLNEH